MTHPIYPHGELFSLADNLWQVEGSLAFPLKRNMTVYRHTDGRLLLYSVIALEEKGMLALEALGTPTWVVVPHPLHKMDLPFYRNRYPHIQVLSVEQSPVHGVVVDGDPFVQLSSLGIRVTDVPGLKFREIVLSLPIPSGGYALCVCDILSKAQKSSGLRGWLLSLLGPPSGFGVARIVRFGQIKDKKKVRDWLIKLSEESSDYQMLLFAHGPAVKNDFKQHLLKAATTI